MFVPKTTTSRNHNQSQQQHKENGFYDNSNSEYCTDVMLDDDVLSNDSNINNKNSYITRIIENTLLSRINTTKKSRRIPRNNITTISNHHYNEDMSGGGGGGGIMTLVSVSTTTYRKDMKLMKRRMKAVQRRRTKSMIGLLLVLLLVVILALLSLFILLFMTRWEDWIQIKIQPIASVSSVIDKSRIDFITRTLQQQEALIQEQRNISNNNNIHDNVTQSYNNMNVSNYPNIIIKQDQYDMDNNNESSSYDVLWNNDFNIVHVIQTRFMQYQSDLISLGYARLDLFTSLTIPSISHQTNTQFLWIIRTDPNLHYNLLQTLIQTLHKSFQSQPSNNNNNNTNNINNVSVILVSSNENPEGFRNYQCIQDITKETILFGSYETLVSYHQAAQINTVLETRLDADDALSISYINTLQKSAATHLNHDNNNNNVGWIVWCAENHMEWQYNSPWNSSLHTGAIIGLKSKNRCITPGLTWGYTIHSSRSDIPTSQHNKIFNQIKKCKFHKVNSDKCLIILGNDNLPSALRARTPTSAGMDHVYIQNYTDKTFPMKQIRKSSWKNNQNELWNALPELFGVHATDLWLTRQHIEENLIQILEDAINGQCTKGHSCKNGTKSILQKLITK